MGRDRIFQTEKPASVQCPKRAAEGAKAGPPPRLLRAAADGGKSHNVPWMPRKALQACSDRGIGGWLRAPAHLTRRVHFSAANLFHPIHCCDDEDDRRPGPRPTSPRWSRPLLLLGTKPCRRRL